MVCDRMNPSKIKIEMEINEGDLDYLAIEKPVGFELDAVEASIGIWVDGKSIFRGLPLDVPEVRGDLCINVPIFELLEDLLRGVLGILRGTVTEAVIGFPAIPSLGLRIKCTNDDAEIQVLILKEGSSSKYDSVLSIRTSFRAFANEVSKTVEEILERVVKSHPGIRAESSYANIAAFLSGVREAASE